MTLILWQMKYLIHRILEHIPENLEDGILYISIEHSVAIHKCACGCGKEVVTPISPNGWKLIFDGETVSLNPSIGNWNLECKSHYFIRNNCVISVGGYKMENRPKRKKKRKNIIQRWFNW